MKLYKNMAKTVGIVIETHYYHMNTNSLASQVVKMWPNENMNSLKFNVKKLIL